MALFLNRHKLNYWITKLIEEAEKEVVLIVPYIQISDNTFRALDIANERGIEIVIVYRENKLSSYERDKLLSFKNVTLLNHPNIHCKCYFNGNLLVVGSMNLYEYSEKNNREMGTLFIREEYENNKLECSYDKKVIFDDAIAEIREIFNGSEPDRLGEITKKERFTIDIIKTDYELEMEKCQRLNDFFLNKTFTPKQTAYNVWTSSCENYFDNITVAFENNRVTFDFNLDDYELKTLYKNWKDTYEEYEIEDFKYYWTYYKKALALYRNFKTFDWNILDDDNDARYKKIAEGISQIIAKYRRLNDK